MNPRLVRFLLLVLFSPFLTSCGDEDRVLQVSCNQSSSDPIAKDFGIVGQEERAGILNTPRLKPGMILRVEPGISRERGSARVIYSLPVSDRDFFPPRHQDLISGRLVRGAFQVNVDRDIAQAADSLHIDLINEIINNTAADVGGYDAERSDLRDPVALINVNNEAVSIVRSGKRGARFIVISGIFYGYGVDLTYIRRSISQSMFKLDKFYVHVIYDCQSAVISNSTSKASILFYYIPIYYDFGEGKVTSDTKQLDLGEFHFSG